MSRRRREAVELCPCAALRVTTVGAARKVLRGCCERRCADAAVKITSVPTSVASAGGRLNASRVRFRPIGSTMAVRRPATALADRGGPRRNPRARASTLEVRRGGKPAGVTSLPVGLVDREGCSDMLETPKKAEITRVFHPSAKWWMQPRPPKQGHGAGVSIPRGTRPRPRRTHPTALAAATCRAGSGFGGAISVRATRVARVVGCVAGEWRIRSASTRRGAARGIRLALSICSGSLDAKDPSYGEGTR